MEIRRLEEQGMTRNVLVQRNTKETKITMSLNLDGTGKASLNTGIGFFPWTRHWSFAASICPVARI